MNVSIKRAPFTFKNGKKIIVEEEQYEFCDDLWRYIKGFLLHEPRWFNVLMGFRDKNLYDNFLQTYYRASKAGISKELAKVIESKVSEAVMNSLAGINRDWSYEETICSALKLPRFKNEALEFIKKAKKNANERALFVCKEYKVEYDNSGLYQDFPEVRYRSFKITNIFETIDEVIKKHSKNKK